ncbi:YtxH domain-containing protein [Cellulomonas sp. RIT-PI-Y]|jgi:hypothetical protein|uniref:YtxH domain-containing protein n=1 Tax=Cellulomonas sp. RIT-PI-Y TaxID=3035297 RepID=UPI0021DA67B8|nr:YtxH domain-containing protein [Cellulomonas sp. RIT-PI-Y]
MKAKSAFVVGATLGYVLGTRAGRARYEQIKGWASSLWHDPRVQSRVDDLEAGAAQFAKDQASALKDKAVDAVRSTVSRTPEPEVRTTPPDGTTRSGPLDG